MFHNESRALVESIVSCGAARASGRHWRNKSRSAVTIGVFAHHGGLRA
ncbi:hypothetical protein J2W94_002810 [Pseudoxanthomonas sacheonensis]|uniref:Uncharacterized protein n=1 Tax=Pseudoxanthomonas sacheonensis TaxID=443615 RepID=A0ABU1RUR5_9GAMM|nr:hypothetical protein [Pseudoxanthomonas sacheonensis]